MFVGHGARSYSWRVPPRRSCLRTLRWARNLRIGDLKRQRVQRAGVRDALVRAVSVVEPFEPA
jgi:hypothetical protein